MNRWMLLLFVGFAQLAQADVVLPKVIDSKMVLQRDKEVPVWGWADQGEEVTVEFAGQVKKVLPDASGKWMLKLAPMPASVESRTMTVKGRNEIKLEDVLVGEVWLASGQSNMELTFFEIAPEEWAFARLQATNRLVRAFHVDDHLYAGTLLDDTIGRWKDCAEIVSTTHSVSAVGFFFALKLQRELGIPVAVLDASWGGRMIEAFIPDEGFRAMGLTYRKNNAINSHGTVEERLAQIEQSVRKAREAAAKGRKIPYIEDRIYGFAENEIHNAMVGPMAPYAIRGAIWYQGESNRSSLDYFKKLQALSVGWSAIFRVKDIPILQVQIAPNDYTPADKNDDTTLCDNIWRAQYRAAEEVPGMGVVPVHDTKIDVRNIHPPCKRPVGERLAALALKRQYDRDVVATGPGVDHVEIDGSTVVVSFKDVDQGLTTTDGKPPSWFELSADGRSFVMADAVISGNAVRVSSAAVVQPRFVRMGWNETAIPNLADKNGWPAFAFPAEQTISGEPTYLSEMVPVSAHQDCGSLQKDRTLVSCLINRWTK